MNLIIFIFLQSHNKQKIDLERQRNYLVQTTALNV